MRQKGTNRAYASSIVALSAASGGRNVPSRISARMSSSARVGPMRGGTWYASSAKTGRGIGGRKRARGIFGEQPITAGDASKRGGEAPHASKLVLSPACTNSGARDQRGAR